MQQQSKKVVVLHSGLNLEEVQDLSKKINVFADAILVVDPHHLDNIVKGIVTVTGGKGVTEPSPEQPRKTIAVATEIEYHILKKQLDDLGIQATVKIWPSAHTSILHDLLANEETREKTMEALKASNGSYTGNIASDASQLVESLVSHFQKFCAQHKGYKAVCDSVIRDLSYELRVRSGLNLPSLPVGEKAVEEGEFIYPKVPQDDIVPKFLTEILSELKGIKDAVKGPSVSVSMQGAQEEAPTEHNSAQSKPSPVPELSNDTNPLEALLAALKDEDVNSATFKGLELINSGVKLNLVRALETGIDRFGELELIRKDQIHKHRQTHLTTLMTSEGIRVGCGAPIGNHTFDLREDGGIIITTKGPNGGLDLTLLQPDGKVTPLDIRGPGHGPVGK